MSLIVTYRVFGINWRKEQEDKSDRNYDLTSVLNIIQWGRRYRPQFVNRPDTGLIFTYLTLKNAVDFLSGYLGDIIGKTSIMDKIIVDHPIQIWYCLTYHTVTEPTIFPLLNAAFFPKHYEDFWRKFNEQKSTPFHAFRVQGDLNPPKSKDSGDQYINLEGLGVAGVSEIMPVCPVPVAEIEKAYPEPKDTVAFAYKSGLARYVEALTRRDAHLRYVKNVLKNLDDRQKEMWEKHLYSGTVSGSLADLLKHMPYKGREE
ncbi:MAG: hypothetical protein ACFFCT_12110 [Candidatus Odinarchaeota archaeon]